MNSLKKALSMLCCISRANPKIVPATTAKYWLERLDARAAVKKKSDNNVVSEALQAKWMDYSIKASQALTIRTNTPALKVSKELVIPHVTLDA
jgi:hypothetical protein